MTHTPPSASPPPDQPATREGAHQDHTTSRIDKSPPQPVAVALEKPWPPRHVLHRGAHPASRGWAAAFDPHPTDQAQRMSALGRPAQWSGLTSPTPVVERSLEPVLAPGEVLDVEVERRGIPWTSLLREVAETLILTFLIFVLIRSLVQNFRIEGFSMEPNLHQGQYLIVNKAIYYLQPPQRGDIIVFEYPRSTDRDFIKRVIGVPGDTVEVRPGQIFINGDQIAEPYGPEQPAYNYGPITLGPDEYFVLGDNRNNSSDSHSWGPLERKFIIGKAWISYWPPYTWGPVSNYPVQARAPTP